MFSITSALTLCLLSGAAAENTAKPNIFFLLTDDQDVILGGLKPMKKLHSLVAEQGTTFSNAMVHTPICCPSRSSYLSGRYLHNSLTFRNSPQDGCANISWAEGPEKDTYAVYAKNAGYRTSYSGKYLNDYSLPGSYLCDKRGDKGCLRTPPGWDDWHGLVGNSRYYNVSIIDNGVRTDYGTNTKTDYGPDLFFNHSKQFLQDHLANHKSTPFLCVLATPSCHGPFTPADKYKGVFNESTAPRTPNYNHSNEDKQWLMRQLSPITDNMATMIDNVHNNRWETLLSVDDYMAEVIAMLEAASVLDNTYIVFTSDHGFQLGNHRLPGDKRHPYEHDIRIPFLIRGPGVPVNVTNDHIVLNIDVAPTFADIVSGQVPSTMDGTSFLPILTGSQQEWRHDFLVTYFGQYQEPCELQKCPPPNPDNFHVIDGKNNTYNCLRTLNTTDDSMICAFVDHENFVELYNHQNDPYQLTNIASSNGGIVANKMIRLRQLMGCKAKECRDL
eukprot:m.42389 g.42389  ORF g.42389 m.42389 type:complete len:500 (+) comp9877_c1_seq3:65-1564(+)